MPRQVVYLFGAGASHACVKAVGSDQGILMRHLSEALARETRALLEDRYGSHPSLLTLVNEVVDESTDYEHIITFLDQSTSALHRAFADDLRRLFERVLRNKLQAIDTEVGETPVGLYATLLDMYRVRGIDEQLGGILTINYDEFIEKAVESIDDLTVDFGLDLQRDRENPGNRSVRLLKLHGSFGWEHSWPVSDGRTDSTLWIPPGIQKAKGDYPFNVLWGLAQEMLDCDVLRIVGCNLGPNDWDLVSLLFTTQLTNAKGKHYTIEIIDAPMKARDLSDAFPYLSIRSLFELRKVGPRLLSELTGGPPDQFRSLAPEEQLRVLKAAGRRGNWFRIWLKQMAETMFTELGSVATPNGLFEGLLEAY